MSKVVLPLIVAVLFVCSGLLNLRLYYQGKRTKPFLFYVSVWILCLAPFCVSSGIADYNDSPPVRFGNLNHHLQGLKQELARKQSEGAIDARAMKGFEEEIQKLERKLSTEKVSEPILPQVPWRVMTVVSLVVSLLVPGGIYLSRLGGRGAPRSGSPGTSDDGPNEPEKASPAID